MTREEKRIWLIRYMQKEMPRYAGYPIPEGEEGQWKLLRGLFNVRPPMEPSPEFLEMQDELLQGMTEEKGIHRIEEMEPCRMDPSLYLWQGDITTLNTDAIVNAANSQMLGCFRPNHSCIDNIIHTMAGVQLRLKCHELMERQGHEEETGQAKLTPAYNLPSKYVIHTVGPIVEGPLTIEHRELLASCYRSCLELAVAQGCGSIAFCCISTGVFGYPKQAAAATAVSTVREFLEKRDAGIRVLFNVFLDEDREYYRRILS